MQAAVLFLDNAMQPLRIESWQRAITDVFLGKCEVIEYSRDKTIKGVSRDWPLPSVVRVLRHFRRDRIRIKFSRLNIYARDRFVCQYDGQRYATEDLTFDHVMPRSRGGRTTWENIVTCCGGPGMLEGGCNARKGDRTPEEAGMRLLRKPKKPHMLPSIQAEMPKNAPPEWSNYWSTVLDS